MVTFWVAHCRGSDIWSKCSSKWGSDGASQGQLSCHSFCIPFLVPCIACLLVEFTTPPSRRSCLLLWACTPLPPSFICPLYPHWGIMPWDCVKFRLFIDELLIFPENTRTSSPFQNGACFFPIRFRFFCFFPLLMLWLSIYGVAELWMSAVWSHNPQKSSSSPL